MENIFDFSKMDKKNVQFPIIKKVLTDEKFYLDKKNLWSQFKRNNFIFNMIIFYKKVLRGFFCPLFRGQWMTFLPQKNPKNFAVKFVTLNRLIKKTTLGISQPINTRR
jgi:hypothetical protein